APFLLDRRESAPDLRILNACCVDPVRHSKDILDIVPLSATQEALKGKYNTKMAHHAGLFVCALFALVTLLISAMDADAVLALNYGSQKAKEYWESQGRVDAASKLSP
ncbi:hypothetical protein MRX96_016512, partial [Rhipicephalus microplus]